MLLRHLTQLFQRPLGKLAADFIQTQPALAQNWDQLQAQQMFFAIVSR
jgi:hypothetical protein